MELSINLLGRLAILIRSMGTISSGVNIYKNKDLSPPPDSTPFDTLHRVCSLEVGAAYAEREPETLYASRRTESSEGGAVSKLRPLTAPKGLEASVRAVRTQPDVQWILELEPSPSQNLLNGKKFQPTPQLNLRDPQAVRLVQLLQTEVENGLPTGNLFGETIGNSLILYLAQHFSSFISGQDQLHGGLPGLRLKRVLEYIEANLSRELHLDELGERAGLSAFYFAKLFKQSTGASPHQYILQRRLERAKELLRKPSMSLSEIGLESGFSDQSHFTNVFRRFVGATPSKFRSSR